MMHGVYFPALLRSCTVNIFNCKLSVNIVMPSGRSSSVLSPGAYLYTCWPNSENLLVVEAIKLKKR